VVVVDIFNGWQKDNAGRGNPNCRVKCWHWLATHILLEWLGHLRFVRAVRSTETLEPGLCLASTRA
jgi:hypothetical protein